MREHFFISSCDGALHDTRAPNWSAHPLRPNFARHHQRIASVADFKATLRAGQFAWPGGYQLYMICDDGAALCWACARKEAREIMPAIASKNRHDAQWRVVACEINYEDSDLTCDHCNKEIPAAYGANHDRG